MKKIKTLVIYYVMFIMLSLISLLSFNQKGNDFFVALSSISADLSLVFSIILVVYALLFCCSDFKQNKNTNKSIISSLFILLTTMIIIFVSFINIYSHRNIFDYIIRVINKKENLDIVVLFLESLFVYIFIYLFSVFGILLNNIYNKYKKLDKYIIILITTILFLIMLLVNIGVKLLFFVWILDIILYIASLLIIKKCK